MAGSERSPGAPRRGQLRTDPRRPLAATATVLAIAGLLVLTGCSTAPSDLPASSRASDGAPASASPAPSATAASPRLRPNGSAEDNLPYFAAVVAKIWASDRRASNRAYIDALADAGFARGDMQMTADTSTVANAAESFQFSVRWGGGQCLVGQVGPSTGDPVTAVLPQLPGGRCLIGRTPPVGG